MNRTFKLGLALVMFEIASILLIQSSNLTVEQPFINFIVLIFGTALMINGSFQRSD